MSFFVSILRLINSIQRPSASRNRKLLKQRGEQVDSFIIREARYEELEKLAHLHVITWNETYPLITNKPTFATRAYQWEEKFSKGEKSWFCYVVENRRNELVGFATGNRYEEPLPIGFDGQLNKIYLLKQYQRLGLGKRLLGFVARRFRQMKI